MSLFVSGCLRVRRYERREDSGRKVSGVVAPTKCSTRGEKANWVFSTEVGGRGIIFQGRLEGEKDRGTTTSRFLGEAG